MIKGTDRIVVGFTACKAGNNTAGVAIFLR